VSVAEASKGAGQEVLVVDGDTTVLKGIERLLSEAGLTVNAFSSPGRARDQIAHRFIPVVLCDLDTPRPGAGLDLLQFVREKSPLSAVLIMSARREFDAVASAFRAGANDVIPKTQEAVPYLRERVVRAAREIKAIEAREKILSEVGELHEEFLKQMMELSRQVTDLEEKLLSREGGTSSSTNVLNIINVLIVDDDPGLAAVLERDLPRDKGWRFRQAQTGGEALDAATQVQAQVLLLKEVLPDLPSSMVLKTIKNTAPDVLALLFTPPSDGSPGSVKMVDATRRLTLVPSFTAPDQLVAQLVEGREALRQKAKERRYLQAFRKNHLEFLQRYNLLKQRIAGSTAR
jgi:DNA-binding NtrC family response regulator